MCSWWTWELRCVSIHFKVLPSKPFPMLSWRKELFGFSLPSSTSPGQRLCSQGETWLLIAVQLQRLIGGGVSQTKITQPGSLQCTAKELICILKRWLMFMPFSPFLPPHFLWEVWIMNILTVVARVLSYWGGGSWRNITTRCWCCCCRHHGMLMENRNC